MRNMLSKRPLDDDARGDLQKREELRKKSNALDTVAMYPLYLEVLPPAYRDDKDIVLAAVAKNAKFGNQG